MNKLAPAVLFGGVGVLAIFALLSGLEVGFQGQQRQPVDASAEPQPPPVEQYVIHPPEDGRAWATMIFTGEDWRNDPSERALLAWFEAHPKLRSLKTTTQFFHYTPADPLYGERWEPTAPRSELPIVRIQTFDGAVGFQASAGSMPATADELARAIERAIAQCQPQTPPADEGTDDGRRPFFIPDSIEINPQIDATHTLEIPQRHVLWGGVILLVLLILFWHSTTTRRS